MLNSYISPDTVLGAVEDTKISMTAFLPFEEFVLLFLLADASFCLQIHVAKIQVIRTSTYWKVILILMPVPAHCSFHTDKQCHYSHMYLFSVDSNIMYVMENQHHPHYAMPWASSWILSYFQFTLLSWLISFCPMNLNTINNTVDMSEPLDINCSWNFQLIYPHLLNISTWSLLGISNWTCP